jgi:hypothetical protein
MDFYTCGQDGTGDGSTSCATCQTHRFTGFSNGAWHRMMQTITGNTLKFYLDGTVVRTSTNTYDYSSLRPVNWKNSLMLDYTTIGNVFNNYYFNGYVKNVYLFDHELTNEDINQLQFR